MQGDRALLAGCDRVYRELRAGVDVAADKDVRLGGLVGERIGDGGVAAAELDLAAVEEVAPLDALADGHQDEVRRDLLEFADIVLRGELVVCVEDGGAAFKFYARDPAVVNDNAVRAPGIVDLDALAAGLILLLRQRRHLFGLFKAEHRDLAGALADRGAGDVDGHVAAADDDDVAVQL